MKSKERASILHRAKEVFFKAMLAGYAGDGSGVNKEKTPDGYRTLTYKEGEFMVVDRYCVTPHSKRSAGTTTIFYEDRAIWWMSYGGWYNDEVIPFLKESLAVAYRRRSFNGGRGPNNRHDKGRRKKVYYVNHVNRVSQHTVKCLWSSGFEGFCGREEIADYSRSVTEPTVLGVHRYFGMSLI